MAVQRFLALAGGRIKEVLGLVVSAGAGDEGKIPALDSAGKLDISLMPVGIGPDTKTMPASETLAAGNIVNVWSDSGNQKARKADATAEGKEAIGFVLVGADEDDDVAVFFEGTITGLSGLTPGTRYYNSAASPGSVTATPPTGANKVVQFVGVAISDTELSFEPGDTVTLIA